MDLLSKFPSSKIYCDRINNSSYEQSININKVYPSIIDLFFYNFDHHYSLIENKDKKMYVKQLLVNIATQIDEDKVNKYDKFNYLKCMNPTLIQQGLQKSKTVSCLLYLSDYYNVTTNVYFDESKSYVVTSDKDRKKFNILFKDNKWSELTNLPDYKLSDFNILSEGLILDVKSKDIYKKYLNPIGKYKAQELIDIAKEMGIPLENNGKKKVKKDLYNDINIYQLNLQ
jgi:hypothetical protein